MIALASASADLNDAVACGCLRQAPVSLGILLSSVPRVVRGISFSDILPNHCPQPTFNVFSFAVDQRILSTHVGLLLVRGYRGKVLDLLETLGFEPSRITFFDANVVNEWLSRWLYASDCLCPDVSRGQQQEFFGCLVLAETQHTPLVHRSSQWKNALTQVNSWIARTEMRIQQQIHQGHWISVSF